MWCFMSKSCRFSLQLQTVWQSLCMCWLLIVILDSVKCSGIYFVIISTIKMSITEKWQVLKMQCKIKEAACLCPVNELLPKNTWYSELSWMKSTIKQPFFKWCLFWLFACLFWVCFYNFAFIWQTKINRFLPFF